MEESVASVPALEVSVSFGRFENESLSWEKWSSFSSNKYLEEVEKCSTPGSVAKKAAYFEAHYKRIAAQKAVLLEQEKEMEANSLRLEDPNCEDHSVITHGTDSELGTYNGQTSPKEVEPDVNLICVENSIPVDKLNEDVSTTIECQHASVEGPKEETDSASVLLDSPKLNKPEETILVQEDTHEKGSQDMVELPTKLDNKTGNTLENKEENAKLGASNKSQKVNQRKKEKNLAGVKKKAAPPLPKSPQISTPKLSKPTSASTVISTTRSSTMKANNSPLPRTKNPLSRESKRLAPTSLHKSLSLGPERSDSTPLTTARKSFIMEKMGDKDIVKRAFKTFQNNFHSTDEVSSGPKQVSTKVSVKKASPSVTRQKENERMKAATEKMNAGRGQSGTKWKSMSPGSPKGAGVNQRNANATPSSFRLRSDERAEKQKEFSNKFVDKSCAKKAERTPHSLKSKEEKEADIKKLRQRFNVKATPMPAFYGGQVMPKSASNKQGGKNETRRQSESHG